MGQLEVIKFLELQRDKGITKHFTIQEIQKGIKEMGATDGQLKGVGNNCYKLSCCNIVAVRGQGLWNHRKLFRIK